jgi:outer membrane protein TolC
VSPPREPEVADANATTAEQLLDEYLRLAQAKSPATRAVRAKERAARELVEPAGALPDPMVSVTYQSMGPPWQPMPPMSLVQGEISQIIPGVGKRQARRNVARAEAERQGVEVEALNAQLRTNVRITFSGIYALDEERRALENGLSLFSVLTGALTGRFVSGLSDQEALAKVELERSRLEEQLLDNSANRQILVTRLNRWLNRPDITAVPRLDALPNATLEMTSLGNDSFTNAPELRIQRAEIRVAERRREGAEAENRSNYLVGFAGGATTTGEPIFAVRFGLELPLWSASKQEPMVRAARHDIEAAEEQYRELELKTRAEIDELKARYERDTRQIRHYLEAIIPNAERALEAARNAYVNGRADFATMIEDYRGLLAARIDLSRRRAERFNTIAEITAIVSKVR